MNPGRKRNPVKWPLTKPLNLPAPPVDDGPARWVETLGGKMRCPDCGGDIWWRDQYLRLHCVGCDPAPPVPASERDLPARREMWELHPLAPGIRIVQLRLFE